MWAFSAPCSWRKLLHFIITTHVLKKHRSRWEDEASYLKLFQILCAFEVTGNCGGSALVGLMEHHCIAEMGTKKICVLILGEMESKRPWQFMHKVVDVVDFPAKGYCEF